MSSQIAPKYLVYTAIFGQYDHLREIPSNLLEPDIFDYVCFTDKMIESRSFSVKTVPVDKPDHLMNRHYKILIDDLITPHYKGSIYLDGNVTVKGRLGNLLNPHYDLIVHDHLRKCVYDEAKAIIKKNKDSPQKVNSWIRYLKEERYPSNAGLYWNGILIREHSNEIKELCREWWKIVAKYSYRDQLSLPYLTKKHSIKINCINRKLDKRGVFCNEYFHYDGRHN